MKNKTIRRQTLLVWVSMVYLTMFAYTSVVGQVALTKNADNGIEQIQKYLHLLQGKRVGMTVNHTSTIFGERSVDVLRKHGVNVVKLFGPEHGFAGEISANTKVQNSKDKRTNISVKSLFGEAFKPSAEDLKDIDIMLFDIQDVGVRFYTYVSTLHYIMESCAENGIPLIVTDRPNPNDAYVDGPILDPKFASFIGMHPVPIVHGMTLGEYAQMINGEGWLNNSIQCDLTVVPVDDYYHGKPYHYDVAPSPNLNSEKSIYLYPSLCWFGATAISDGRGTLAPYLQIGHPSFKGIENQKYAHSFIPQPILGMNEQPKLAGEHCFGLDLRSFPTNVFREGGKLNLSWLLQAYHDFPDSAQFFNGEANAKEGEILHFDRLAGSDQLRTQIHARWKESDIRKSWEEGLREFQMIRKRYLLYPDVPEQIKFMCYNIHHGYTGNEENRIQGMADLIASLQPDFVALQEVDSVCERSSFVDQARFLGEENHMHHIFMKHFKLGEGSYGNAILSKYPILAAEEHRLPVQGNPNGVVFMTIDVEINKQIIRVANVHMDYRAQDSRLNQAHLIQAILSKSPYPVVLMGDFNAQPYAAEIQPLLKDLSIGSDIYSPTFPVENANRTIDYILVGPEFKKTQAYTFQTDHSDHLPIIGVFELKAKK